MISEREKLEFESLPEFIREPYTAAREPYAPPSAVSSSVKRNYSEPRRVFEERVEEDFSLPKTAELEALWPGVNHDFLQAPRKTPSFFLTIGFMAGAIVSVAVCWVYSAFNHGPVSASKSIDKKVVLAGAPGSALHGHGQAVTGSSQTPMHSSAAGDGELIVPLYPTYEVKDGDTLAGIALQAYKRASPRLLDEICRANDMRSAHVLQLGQKLILPEYRLQTSQVAAGAGSVQ